MILALQAERLLGVSSAQVLAECSSLEADYFENVRPRELALGGSYVPQSVAVGALRKLATRVKGTGLAGRKRADGDGEQQVCRPVDFARAALQQSGL